MRSIRGIGITVAATACCLSLSGVAHADTPAPTTPLSVTTSAATAGAAKKAAYAGFTTQAAGCTDITDRTETNTQIGPGSWVYAITATCKLGDDTPTGDGWAPGKWVSNVSSADAAHSYSAVMARCGAVGNAGLAKPPGYFDDYRCVATLGTTVFGLQGSVAIWWHLPS